MGTGRRPSTPHTLHTSHRSVAEVKTESDCVMSIKTVVANFDQADAAITNAQKQELLFLLCMNALNNRSGGKIRNQSISGRSVV